MRLTHRKNRRSIPISQSPARLPKVRHILPCQFPSRPWPPSFFHPLFPLPLDLIESRQTQRCVHKCLLIVRKRVGYCAEAGVQAEQLGVVEEARPVGGLEVIDGGEVEEVVDEGVFEDVDERRRWEGGALQRF